jgi:ATP synthase protein I
MKDPQGARPLTQVLYLQLVVLLLAGVIVSRLWGQAAAEAAMYGALIALANTGLLMWRMRRSARGESGARRPLKGAYRSSVERFALVTLLLGVGMGLVKLQPLALTLGFTLGQLAWIVAPLLHKTNT